MLDKGKPKGLPHVPYLRNVNVQWGRVDTSSVWTMELGEHEHERFGLRAGDLLICEGGEPGRCAVWQGSSEFTAFQKALHRARPGPNLTTGFLRYYLEHLVSSGAIAKFCTGSTIAHLPQQQLRRVPVPLPPVAEQRRIVEILEEHLSHLDASEVELQRSGTRLEVLWASTLSNSRSGIQVALPAVTEIQGGIQKQPKRAPVANHYPFLRVANVTATGLDLRDVHRVELFGDELERLRLLPGDLLVVEGNGSPAQIGRAAAWDGSIDNCVHQNHLIRVRPLPGLLPGYLEAVWNSPEHRRTLTDVSSSSSGLHTLSVSKLKRLSIPVPSLETQADLLSRVQEVRSALDRQRTAISGAIAKGRALRRAVLAAAFEGKLTGRHTDVEVLEELAEA
ncbi:restriction endonuclease subunit S [Nostocoides jenkinsii]|nr:restriction endonuclease subunit S [Tetrasphaera jenkinsii]